jgi:hypothetical protein
LPLPPPQQANPIDSERLQQDLWIKYFMASQGLNDKGFNSKLYIKNSEWDPPNAPEIVEDAINIFEAQTLDLFHHSRSLHHEPNLTSSELKALQAVKKENRFVVCCDCYGEKPQTCRYGVPTLYPPLPRQPLTQSYQLSGTQHGRHIDHQHP